MRWEDESYVRIYVRDTPDLSGMGWEARAVLWEVFRKMDRAGILELGKSGRRGLAGLTQIPLEVVNRAMDVLLEDGVLTMQGSRIVCPNFMAAQECTKSDKLRQKEHRAKARADAMSHDVTLESQDVTLPSQNVTESHERSQSVTSGHAVSLCAVPCSSTPNNAKESYARVATPVPSKSSHDWLTFFNLRFFEVKGKQRGAAADAKASANLQTSLDGQSVEERAEDWCARVRIVDEFLARTDERTMQAGWQFSFFVSSFDGLRISPSKRPKVDRFGKPEPEITVTHSRYR